MDQGRQKYLTIPGDQKADKAVEVVLEHFRDKDRREEFYGFFRELEELHEIISPDPFMRPFLDDYGKLAAMYEVVKGSYDRGVIVDKSFLRKTAQLVREHTSTTEIRAPTKLQKLDAEILAALAEADQPDTVKVFNLLKAIDQLTSHEANREPYLISIGDKAEAIAQAFEDRQSTTQDTLAQLRRLIQEINEARQERDATELSAESFAVYWLLKKDGIAQADMVAKAARDPFERCPHWQTSRHQEQEVRKAFYKALINAGVQGVVDVAQGILKMLRRATP
jgi:type I restriction enzyme, R subunit